MPRVSFGLSEIPWCSEALNPESSTLKSYTPGNRLVNVNAPRSSVTSVRTALVALLLSVTVAPETAPPLASPTLPRNVAVVPLDCAEEGKTVPTSTSSRTRATIPLERSVISRRSPEVLDHHEVASRIDLSTVKDAAAVRRDTEA